MGGGGAVYVFVCMIILILRIYGGAKLWDRNTFILFSEPKQKKLEFVVSKISTQFSFKRFLKIWNEKRKTRSENVPNEPFSNYLIMKMIKLVFHEAWMRCVKSKVSAKQS